MGERLTPSDVEKIEKEIEHRKLVVRKEAIEAVECDPYDGEDGGPSYWVYTAPGWLVADMDCHTIHEDTLAKLKPYIQSIEPWPDDPELMR